MSGENRQRVPGTRSSSVRRCRELGEGIAKYRHLWLECLEVRRLLSLSPIISEIEAGNSAGILDSAGVAADWLELYNPDPTTAVNLAGWSLKYQKTGSSNSTTWIIPSVSTVMLGPGEFRVVFCDSVPQQATIDPVQELHADFNLNKTDGATVKLMNTSGTIVDSRTYPGLNSDTSYGLGETVTETKLVAAGATATYLAPTGNSLDSTWMQNSFSDANWASGPTGLGFKTVTGFAVTVYKSNLASVADINTANAVVSTSANQSWTKTETAPYVNYVNTDFADDHFSASSTTSGQIVADRTYPGMKIGSEVDYYVMQATGTITIPSAGNWTFCANTDDGFSATINGTTFQYNGLRGASDTLYTIYFTSAGTYPVTFMQFQNGGGANAEFSAAPGYLTSFGSTFRLVGDTVNGGLKVTSTPFYGVNSNGGQFAAAASTNVKPAIQSAITAAGGTSLYTRIKFDAANYSSQLPLTLKMQYDDGFVAYLNGVKIASRNAPASPTFNSLATERNSDVQATTFENFNVSSFAGLLTSTGNVLAVQVLLSSNSLAAGGDLDMLVVPELSQITSIVGGEHYFSTPTPGTANTLGNIQPDISFSQTHGFYYAPFQVTLASNIAGALVRYTTDNGTPTAAAASSTKTISQITYGGPNNLTATVTCTGHGFYTGCQVQIAGAAQLPYDGIFNITVLSPNMFTYVMSGSPGANGTGTMTAAVVPVGAANTKTITRITYGGTNNLTATVTSPLHGFASGQKIQIAGATPSQYDGLFTVTVIDVNTFTYTMTSAPGIAASGANMAASPVKAITGITYGGSNNLTARVSATGHGFATGQQVQIGGASPWQYDGVFTITVVDANTFTYTMSVAPGTAASGASMTASAVSTLTYTGPITVNTTTVLRAAIAAGGSAGPVETESYIFPVAVAAQPAAPASFPTTWYGNVPNADGSANIESTAANYAMSTVPGYTTQQVVNALSSLPTMSLVTTNDNLFGTSGIYSNSYNKNSILEAPGSFEYFDPNNASTDYSAIVGLQLYGGVGRSAQFDKHSFAVLFDQSSGPSLMNYDIFGDGYRPDRLILRHGFNDGWAWGGASSQYIIDQWTRDTLTALGTQNTPGIWVQLFVNGLYWGLYNAVAHVDNNYAANYFGGQSSDYDIIHVGSGFSTVSGDTVAWNQMFNVARYGNTTGTGTASTTALQSSTAYTLMQQYLNLPEFCDYIITEYYGGNWDWDGHNYTAIFSKTAGTGFVFNDWDGEGMLLNALNTNPAINITNRDTSGGPTELFVQLLANSDFRAMFADHVYRDLSGVLSPTNAAALYRKEANTVGQAIIDESARWGNITGIQYTPANWTTELNLELGTFFPSRAATMFSQFETSVTIAPPSPEGGSVTYTMYPSFDPPTLKVNGATENGGFFTPGNLLTMAAATGTIYYTISTPGTPASDPRASGGAVNVAALIYTGAITLTQNEHIEARVRSGTTWSALNDSSFYVDLAPSIRITELMYSPAPATGDEIAHGYATEDFEFVELQNTGTAVLPLQGLAFTNGITYTFPNVSLSAGATIVVVSNAAAFAYRYRNQTPSGPQILSGEYGANWASVAQYGVGVTGTHFNNGGEIVTLTAPNGGEILSFAYSNSWYPQTDGEGFSLVVRNVAQATALWDSSSGWEPGGTPGGTPAAAETVALPLPDSIIVNEVMSHTSVAPGDMIEFYNTTSQPINVGGWFVSDSSSNLMKYRIAAGTVIAAHRYLVLTEDNNFGTAATADSGCLVPFALNEHGDDVYLSSNYGLQVGGYRQHQNIGSTLNGVSRGLYTKSDGGTTFAVSSITRNGTTATVILDTAQTTLQSGDHIHIQGAAQAQYNGDFIIANVTVNPGDGTTTFTCTVTGSPESPATPGVGQSLSAATGGTDFTLLQAPTFGALSGTTYSGAPNSIPYVSPLVTDEIMYHPSTPTAAETVAGYAASDFEYIELYNRSSTPVALGNYYVAGGVGYTQGWLADGNLANNFTVSGITLSGTTSTVTIGSTSTGFQNGDRIHIDGAAQPQYNGDFVIANVSSDAGTTSFTYSVTGSPASPATPAAGQSITAGKNSEFQTLESGATATWSGSNVASASYSVYVHLNLYDGDNNLRTDLDSTAQYTVTCGGTSTKVLINQNQIPATFNVASLAYNNLSGLVTANGNNSLGAGSIIHISGAVPAQYDGTFVVQSATASTFTFKLTAGLNLIAATGAITAGLNDAWINLGTYTLNGSVSVQLTRTTSAKPSEWTVADSLELVGGQGTIVFGAATFSSYAVQHPAATLAPGAYAVLASNYAAFDERYHVAANNILVLGTYSGHLNNGGDTIDIYQIGNRDDGSVAPANGYVPSYRVDHINFKNGVPWPTEPDGNGPALIRVHTADYGNDPMNWAASNVGGTPGKVNIVIDMSAPSIPTNLAGQPLLSPTSKIHLTWNAASDPQSNIDHYVIYRNSGIVNSSTTPYYDDAAIAAGTNYTYTVTAVNRDGYGSAPSASISIGLPGVISNAQPGPTQIDLVFSEPLTASLALTLSNYTVSGKTISNVALARDNTKVTLTLSSSMATGTAYTVTMRNLTTVSGSPLPATQTFTFTYANQGTGSILWEFYGNIGGGTAITDLTSASIYPNNPTQTGVETSFEAPHDFADNYGERIRGYLYPPTTGNYIFTIASDDNGELWLSTNDSPANLVKIAHVDSWTGYRDWDNASNAFQKSASIYLTAGQRYYVQALQKEGGGGDNLSVRWEIPATTGGAASTWELNSSGIVDSTIPIPGIRLATPSSIIDTTPPPAPVNLRATVTNNNTQITLAWSPVNSLLSGVDHYNVYRDGSSTVYGTTTTTSFLDSTNISPQIRHSYQVAAVNYDLIEGTKSSTVTAVPVGIASISAGTATSVLVTFTEPVDSITAQVAGNYQITASSATVTSAVLQADTCTVLLTTSALDGGNHTLTINGNVKTQAGSTMPTNFLASSFTYTGPSWTATIYQASTSYITGLRHDLNRLSNAQTVVSTPADQSWTQTFYPATINFTAANTVTLGNFTNDAFLPNQTSLATAWNDFVISATSVVYIPTAGVYTFDVTSDDGFSLTLPAGVNFSTLTGATNASGSNVMKYDGSRGTGDTFGQVNFTSAGYYPIRLLYFQGNGGASVEVSASAGSYTSWNSNFFHLIGDTANGGLGFGCGYTATLCQSNGTTGTLGNLAMAQTVASTPADQSWSQLFYPSILNFTSGNSALGHFTNDVVMPNQTAIGTEQDNYVISATGSIYIPAAGNYTFDVDSADGFSLTIPGANFTTLSGATNSSGSNSMAYDGARGTADTLGVTYLTVGYYPISFLFFKGTGISSVEVSAAAGSYTTWNSSFHLVGDTANGGLGLIGGYNAPALNVAVNQERTGDTSPTLAGTVSDSAATVTVRVNSDYYAATNNGDGTWSLPHGIISPSLGSNTYDVVAVGVNAAGIVAFDSTANDLSIDTTSPTVTVISPTSPTASPVDSIAIQFSEPVQNFTLRNLQFSLANGGPTLSKPLEGAILATNDNQNWTLANLSGLAVASGNYVLTLVSLGSTIADMNGNPLVTDASATWNMINPAVVSIGRVGLNPTNAASVQYSVTFNKSVTNVLAADFALAANGTTGTIASPIIGSGSTYTVTVNGVSGNGTLGLNLVDDNSIQDLFSNPLGGPGTGDGNFSGQLFTVDNSAPTISLSGPSVSNTTSGPVTYTVTYADTSFISSSLAAGSITLDHTGTASGTVDVSGLNLTYTVTISNITGDGTLGISIAAGTAWDQVGNLSSAAGPSKTFTVNNTRVAVAAAATPNPSNGVTTALSVLGADASTSEANLTYTWAATNLPDGATPPVFSANGNNAAKNTTVTFSKAGTYELTATVTDPVGLTATSSVSVTVNQVLTTISLAGQPFQATALDQFGNALADQPIFDASSDTITSPLALASNVTLLPAAGSRLTFSGGISGTGRLIVNSSGSVVLSGSNSYSGGTTVTAGTLILTNPSAIAAGTSLTIGADAANIFSGVNQTLTRISNIGQPPIATAFDQFGNPLVSQPTFDVQSDTITSSLILPGNVTVVPEAGTRLTISGRIAGAGALTISGPGTVVLSGESRYRGGTTVSAGTLVLAASSAITAGTSLMVGSDASLIFNTSLDATPSAFVAATFPVMASAADTTVAFHDTEPVTTRDTILARVVRFDATRGSSANRALVTAKLATVVNRDLHGCSSPLGTVLPTASHPRQALGSGSPVPMSIAQPRWWSAINWMADHLARFGQAATNSDNPDSIRKKDAAMLAMEAVFAVYDR